MQGIESLTTAAVSTALDAASLRQQVIAANIANAGRLDYVAQKATFEATFAGLVRESDATRAHGDRAPLDLAMRVEPDRDADGATHAVQLDGEMTTLVQNSVHYQALVKSLNKYMSVMASAVSEGKR